MITLVIGGSGSGKSSYAENYITSFCENKSLYYLATMRVKDEEDERKIEKHHKLRYGKGFITIEQPTDIQDAVKKMQKIERGGGVLLECILNLAANEMFSEDGFKSGSKTAAKIIAGIEILRSEVWQLVIVSGNVFEDGKSYDKNTMEYIRAVGSINAKLAEMADKVVEVVVGIPIIIKG